MHFLWDERKNEVNFKRHGIWFEEAQTVWADELAVEYYDPDHSEEEDRFIRVGHSSSARLLLVVYCERTEGEVIRIISARKATAKESKAHEEGI